MAETGKFPNWKQALITFLGGIVLAGTSCFGFFLSLGSNFESGGDQVLTPLTIVVFCASLLIIFIGFIFILILVIRAMTEKRPQPPPPQAPLPPEPPTPGAPV